MAPGSEPASGSDCANAVVFSPRRTGKRYFSFCAALSVNSTGFTSGPNTPGPRGGSAMVREISSHTTAMPSRLRPWPPYSVGTSSSQRPKSFALRSRSARTSARSAGPSIACISIGMSSRSTKVLTVCLSSLSSSGSSKSMAVIPVMLGLMLHPAATVRARVASRVLGLALRRRRPAALDLHALDDLGDHAAERNGKPQTIGLAQHDAHVLLRPGHRHGLRTHLQRPVRRAALEQRRAQALLIDPEPLRQLEALVIGRNARPQDQVVDHLADLARAQLTEMKDAAGEARKRRFARLESFRIAADHHQQLPGPGRRLAARERHVEKHDSRVSKSRGQPRHGAGRDGRSDPDDEPATRGAGDAIATKQDGFRLVVEADHDDDKIAALRHRAGIGRQSDAGLLRLGARVRVDIVSRDLELGPCEMTRHRVSHLAKPDDADTTNDACAHSPTFLVSTGFTHCRREPNFGDNKPPRAHGVPTGLERGASPQHGGNAGRDIAAAHARCVLCCATTPDRTLHRRRKDRAVMTLALLIEQLFNGVQFGLMLFLMAVGVTLVFGIMRVINLAHGSLFMLGGYFLMAALAWTRSYGLAIPLAFLGAALVAVVLEIVVLRPLYRRGPLDQVLATFGLT